MDMHNDISKRTVLVLLVLTLVVSVVGTWTILSMPSTVHRTVELSEPAVGQAKININPPVEQPMVGTSGKAVINIKQPE